ncbi:unnamed protein product [Ectocarpus sp. CCAP 1310/34]|nr:unnamed protein product [Ectocarpus sp. CCAP 1310/34]
MAGVLDKFRKVTKTTRTPKVPFTLAPRDYGALAALYHLTQGDGWIHRDGWCTPVDLQEWFGVDVNEQGRVVKLDLRGNNLQGTIPTVLGTLDALEHLDLSHNQLSGSIPCTLANLGELQVLILEANQLSGVVSPELGDIRALRYLELGGNYLSGGGPKLGESISSWRLRLRKQQQVVTPTPQPEVPPPMASPDRDALVALFHATGGDNWTRKSNWCTAARLGTWEGVQVNQQGRVVELDLSDNNLRGAIPGELGKLGALRNLSLAWNKLSGPIPPDLGNLTSLEMLSFWKNELSGAIPKELKRLTALNVLFLNDNRLTGCIPEDLAALTKLEQLVLYSNRLSGSVPQAVKGLSQLELLRVSNNLLAEESAETESLDRSEAKRDGPRVESPVSEVTLVTCAASTDRDALVALFISTNGANWTCNDNWDTDAELGTWHGVDVNERGRVVKLQLGLHNLRGPIPEALVALDELEVLQLDCNMLTGFIPKAVGVLTKLEKLMLNNNQLSGAIPPELGQLGALEYLMLMGNNLSGPIPEALGDLSELKMLGLNNNRLKGPTPKTLGKLSKLEELGLSNNMLDGCIPEELAALTNLRWLQLQNNKLTGSIPEALRFLSKLKELRLSNNKLSGTVPEGLGGLTGLRGLLLNDNNLEGVIPEALGALSELKRLDLSNNSSITGGSEHGNLDSWRARIQPQQQREAEHDEPKEEADVAQHSPRSQDEEETVETDIVHPGPSSPAEEERDPGDSFREQVASFAGLAALTKGDREALDEIKQLIRVPPIRAPYADGVSPAPEPIDEANLRDLNRLAEMATTLGEIASSHMEDQWMQGREQGLSQARKAYFNAVRDGVCNAFLASSVVGSNLVATSKTGGIGTAGKALALLSAAVPMVGGLGGIAAGALKTGDRYIQTRRVAKIADIARDAVECCSLARRLALRLAEGLAIGASIADTVVGTIGGAGGGGWRQGEYALPDGAGEKDVMEWFADEVSNFEPQHRHATRMTPEEQAGSRLGKKHLQTLLLAVGTGCLEGANNIEEKVELLVRTVFPEDEGNAVSTPRAPNVLLEQVPSPIDSVLKPTDSPASPLVGRDSPEIDASTIAALMEEMRSLWVSLKDWNAKHSDLENEVSKIMEKVKSLPDSDGVLSIGEGQALKQRVYDKTPEKFLEASEHEAVALDQPVLAHVWRESMVRQAEINRGHDDRIDRLEGKVARKQDQKRGIALSFRRGKG